MVCLSGNPSGALIGPIGAYRIHIAKCGGLEWRLELRSLAPLLFRAVSHRLIRRDRCGVGARGETLSLISSTPFTAIPPKSRIHDDGMQTRSRSGRLHGLVLPFCSFFLLFMMVGMGLLSQRAKVSAKFRLRHAGWGSLFVAV